jgi:mitochondrial fission protein ELM1
MPAAIQHIWRLTDGKPGHMKQTAGIAAALRELANVHIHDCPVRGRTRHWWRLLRGRSPFHELPTPRLILGAGHRTHVALLAAGRATGAATVVLMRPTLPRAFFDLVIVPRHDGVSEGPRVFTTIGAPNLVRPSTTLNPQRGLVLLGGPSRHFHWQSQQLMDHVSALVASTPDCHWTIADSRRTPPEFLQSLAPAGTDLCSHATTPPGWMEEQLAQCGVVWVTPDSVSMVHEALSSGAVTGIFPMRQRGTRAAQGICALMREGRLLTEPVHIAAATVQPRFAPLQEASRCAAELKRRFLA